MKEYNLYVPCPPANGTAKTSDSRLWLEKTLMEQFGTFRTVTGFHEGVTLDFGYRGKIQAYSVCAEERKARPFFKQLKRQIKEDGRPDILIVEKEAPGPQGGLPGERI
jgi:hypothetical protein